MQCYMSKKIALPKSINMKSIAWNKTHGYIACGGEGGILKVLKLESRKEITASVVSSSSLSTNQSLEGHTGTVSFVQWNEPYQKLTSCDTNGFIMVWMEHKGIWYEEMVNNRQKSLVKGMSWNHDGMKICITYDDGVVIVGSVDGNRIWGKELKGLNLTCVEWSPDGRLLLLGCNNGEVHIYEFGGAFVGKIPISTLADNKKKDDLMMISWFKKQKDPDIPSLAVVFESGHIQLMKNENDSGACVIDTGLIITSLEWNFSGSIIAVAGKREKISSPDEKSHEVKFINPFGEVLHILRFGGNICGLSWEGDGQRIALAVDCYIFFATVRPYYKWCYFSNTLAYAFSKSLDRKETTIMFWNSNTKEKHIKLVKNLFALTSHSDFCCIATRSDDLSKEYSLIVCNAIGSPIDLCNVSLEPSFLCMNGSDVFAASRNCFCKFHFHSPKSKSLMQFSSEKPGLSEERCTVYDLPNIEQYSGDNLRNNLLKPICCITCSDSVLLLGDSLARFYLYSLPQVSFYSLIQSTHPGVPSKIALNCVSDVMACINVFGEITFHAISDYWNSSKNHSDSNPLSIKRSSFDSKQPFQKTTESGIIDETSDSRISRSKANFNSMKSGKFSLSNSLEPNGIMIDNEESESFGGFQQQKWRSSKTVSDSLSGFGEKSNFNSRSDATTVSSKPIEFDRKCAWDILWASDDGQMCAIMDKMRMYIYRGTEPEEPMTCLGYMCEFKDLEVKAVLLTDLMQNPDEPEDVYFFKNDVKSLRDTRNLISNVGLKDAAQFIEENPHPRLWRLLAEGALLKMDFTTAESAFVRCKDYQGIQFVKNVSGINNDTIKRAEVQAYFGNFDEVDRIYLSTDRVISAIDLHRLLGNWFRVFELLKGDLLEVTEMEEAWNGVADYYFDRQQWSEALNYYEKAHNEDRIAECQYMLEDYSGLEKLLNDLPENHALLPELGSMFASVGMCEQAVSSYIKFVKELPPKFSDPLLLRKIYVLIAILIEEYKSNRKVSNFDRNDITDLGISLEEEVALQNVAPCLIDDPWRGAKAYHFYMLAQKHLYQGYMDAAMKTALHLREYDDILNPEDIYSLLALSSCANRAFATCSSAFMRLESLESLTPEEKSKYESLAAEIFVKHPPKDSRNNVVHCRGCGESIPDWYTSCPSCSINFPICVASGRPILNPSLQWTCLQCHHAAFKQEMLTRSCCALCHCVLSIPV
ncbi:WD repeat-containing protein 35 isoform X2 [Parasteatoda tepidariorum]|uniref:WD repeat-containing protein 35 isoform X2 n=1 Tax=Parasteatoda tepidariorum TaxID=114398 RepID=UPI001C72623D|nr:WD repeat-containing protein 35 isoform X2 [Parasteatoda tepidariorum]